MATKKGRQVGWECLIPRNQDEVDLQCQVGVQWCHVCERYDCGDNMHENCLKWRKEHESIRRRSDGEQVQGQGQEEAAQEEGEV